MFLNWESVVFVPSVAFAIANPTPALFTDCQLMEPCQCDTSGPILRRKGAKYQRTHGSIHTDHAKRECSARTGVVPKGAALGESTVVRLLGMRVSKTAEWLLREGLEDG